MRMFSTEEMNGIFWGAAGMAAVLGATWAVTYLIYWG